MTDTEFLEAIKSRIGAAGNTYVNDTISGYITDVKAYMVDGGVPSALCTSNDTSILGCVARGVSDLWNYGAGSGVFSAFFYQRMGQLAAGTTSEDAS